MFKCDKSPLAQLPYTINWAKWLNGDTITSAMVTVEGGDGNLIVASQSNTATTITGVLSGGTINDNYKVVHQITTETGLVDTRIIMINVIDR
jgi:hypothetical protein